MGLSDMGMITATRAAAPRRRSCADAWTNLFLALVLLCGSGLIYAQAPGDPRSGRGEGLRQEYFIEQRANEAVLIRINAFEATVVARVLDRDRQQLVHSESRASRLAPLFQYLPATSGNRQLDIEALAPTGTDRSRFDIEFSRLTVRDDRSAMLATGYRLLSAGLAVPELDSAAVRAVQVRDLGQAAEVFRRFGMEELRLWASLHAAALTLSGMGDASEALGRIRLILGDDGSRRHPEIQLAALDLQTEALALLRDADALPVPAEGPDPLQESARLTAQLAATRGEQFIRARALALSGADYADRELTRDAFDRFQAALRVADDIGADDLGTDIREALVAIHGTRGEVTQSGEVLREIESQLSESGQGEELARNLLAQGRLLNRTYRYGEARDVLQEALNYQRNSVTETEVRLELAHALFELGELDAALTVARAAVTNPSTGAYRRPTGLLDLSMGIGIVAAVLRERREFDAMRQAREAQRSHLRDARGRAAWSWERIQDERATGGAASSARLGELARGNLEPWRSLASLQGCAQGAACEAGVAGQARDRLRRQGVPRWRAEGELLWAEWRARSGDARGAIRGLEQLVSELRFLRAELPGVLGAWAWRRAPLASERYLDLLMRHASPAQGLLGLAQVRHATVAERWAPGPSGVRRTASADDPAQRLDTDEFRAALANREEPSPAGAEATEAGDVATRMERARRRFEAASEGLSLRGLEGYLQRLGPDQAVLDFYLGGTGGWVFLGVEGEIRRLSLPRGGGLAEALALAGEQAAVLDGAAFDRLMTELGDRLLEPLRGRLPRGLLLPGSGPLARIPLGALRRDGRYLLENHEVALVPTFPLARVADPENGGSRRIDADGTVFLAGDPRDFSSEYLTRLESSPELRAVAYRFVGPGLTLVQGAALLADEFDDPRYGEARLLHLAMPALVDLGRPSAAGLQLSEQRRGEGRGLFSAKDLVARPVAAELAVLSQADWRGRPTSAFDHRPPLVSELLAAGSDAVLVSLWPTDPDAAVRFFEGFYERLGATGSPTLALAETQRSLLADGAPQRTWAGFRLYLN